jgi:hypothetical protein
MPLLKNSWTVFRWIRLMRKACAGFMWSYTRGIGNATSLPYDLPVMILASLHEELVLLPGTLNTTANSGTTTQLQSDQHLLQPVEDQEELQLTGESLGGLEAPLLNEMVMHCKEEATVDVSHEFNLALELGKGWVGMDTASLRVIVLVLAEERGLSECPQ